MRYIICVYWDFSYVLLHCGTLSRAFSDIRGLLEYLITSLDFYYSRSAFRIFRFVHSLLRHRSATSWNAFHVAAHPASDPFFRYPSKYFESYFGVLIGNASHVDHIFAISFHPLFQNVSFYVKVEVQLTDLSAAT